MTRTAQQNWWGRNWKWVVPVVCLSPVLFCCGWLTLIYALVFGSLKSSEPYHEALARAKADPRIQAALGEPIEEGFFVMGGTNESMVINMNGVATAEVNTNLSIPISGPNGSGTIEVVAKKSGGKWAYSTLRVTISGGEEAMYLLGGN